MKILILSIIFIVALLLLKAFCRVLAMAVLLKKGYYPCYKCGEWKRGDFIKPVVMTPSKKIVLICHKCKFKLDEEGTTKEVNIDEL